MDAGALTRRTVGSNPGQAPTMYYMACLKCLGVNTARNCRFVEFHQFGTAHCTGGHRRPGSVVRKMVQHDTKR